MKVGKTGTDNKTEVRAFDALELDAGRLSSFRRYFEDYFNDEFRYGQGTEGILNTLARFGRGGEWLDLGAGPSTLFWSIPLDDLSSVSCCDVAAEALRVLDDFVRGDEVPICYEQVLKMYGKTPAHLSSTKRKVSDYYLFDAMRPWPEELANRRYDLLTEFGLFGLAPSPERYLTCFDHLRPHLRDNARLLGADWIRSADFIREEGHDNSYLSPKLIAEAAGRLDAALLHCRRHSIEGDPLYDAVIVWAMDVGPPRE